MLPETFLDVISVFATCFTQPSFDRFVTVVTGWALCVGKHTVTGALRAAGVVGHGHHSGYHRFFSQAAWSRDHVNKKLGRAHRKKTALANELIQLVAAEFPDRQFRLIGDNAFANCSILRPLPPSFHFVGRARLDASLNAKPERHQRRGRPRIRGRKLASPDKRGKRPWKRLTVEISGRPATVQVQVFDALWYKVARGRLLRFVLVRGWPGHVKDDVLVTTDLTLTANEVITYYCSRWSIEETFGWVKSRLGFEDPQNRTEPAAERTAPMALWTYSLVIHWYREWSKRRTHLPFREAPWYTSKAMPSFADMLATLRRESWTLWISDQAANDHLDQKHLAPMLDIVGYG
jgi:hypothetical protein